MKLKKYFLILFSLLYLDLIFILFSHNSFSFNILINILLFDLINSFIISIVTSLFKDKINKIITYIVFVFLGIWYSIYFVFFKVFLTPFSLTLLKQSDQVLKFSKGIYTSIFQNIIIILMLFVPIIILIIFRKKIKFKKLDLKDISIYIVLILLSTSIYMCNILLQGKSTNSPYNLFYETNNISLNIQKLGVMGSTYLDLKRLIFGFNEKIKIQNVDITDLDGDAEKEIEYEYNNLDLTFEGGSGEIESINTFLNNELGTKKNEYTGMFKDKNLIYIVAESFSEIAVSKEYTPTLYKLVHDGFYFENFYTSNNLSTIGGEFQALTGLYADNSILSKWRGGYNYFPYGLATIFKNLNYNTFAYHNNSAYFQDRNIYLKSQGFDNFKGCYNGMEKLINCSQWPQSDIEMISATIDDYINDENPFMAYYMTVSGHFYYSFSENSIARKYRDIVKDLDYPEEVKGYLATQIELDKALELLLDELDKHNKLDDTVIVLLADHYPYNLSISNINLLSSYERDSLIEANSNNLIIYNSKIKNTKIDKVGMSIDVLPTVLNLFGIDYDSRIIMGKDILSTTEGIAIFKDKSWVTNKGTYHASSNTFDSSDDEVSDEYIDNINNIVNNRVAISRMIVNSNYYKYLFNN